MKLDGTASECTTGAPLFSSAALAYCLVALLNGALVVVKGANPIAKRTLVGLTGHHWTAHALLLLAALVLLTVLFRVTNTASRLGLGFSCLLRYTVVSTVVGITMIVAFYAIHG